MALSWQILGTKYFADCIWHSLAAKAVVESSASTRRVLDPIISRGIGKIHVGHLMKKMTDESNSSSVMSCLGTSHRPEMSYTVCQVVLPRVSHHDLGLLHRKIYPGLKHRGSVSVISLKRQLLCRLCSDSITVCRLDAISQNAPSLAKYVITE